MHPPSKPDPFAALIAQHKGILYKVANAYCQDPEDRKDLIQEITLQLWLSQQRYDPQYKMSTWIYRIALNVAISFYRKALRRRPMSVSVTEALLQLPEESSGAEMEQQINALQAFIRELRELDRALMLLYLEEKSYREMAEILGITETNVATKISRIKDQLKQKFAHFNNS